MKSEINGRCHILYKYVIEFNCKKTEENKKEDRARVKEKGDK